MSSNPVNRFDTYGLIEFVYPDQSDNLLYDGTNNCQIIKTCRDRIEEFTPKPPELADGEYNKAREKILDLIKGMGTEIAKDQLLDMLCATMNSERCNSYNPDIPIWPSDPNKLLEEQLDVLPSNESSDGINPCE